jgi:hypothetical protein
MGIVIEHASPSLPPCLPACLPACLPSCLHASQLPMKPKTLLLGCSGIIIALVLAGLGVVAYFFVYFGPQWNGPTNFAQQRFTLAANALGTPQRPFDQTNNNWPTYDRIRTTAIAVHERVLGYSVRQPRNSFKGPEIFDANVDKPDPALAQSLIAAMDAAGVFADLDRLVLDPRAVRPEGEGDVMADGFPDLSIARHLTRINSYRFRADFAKGNADAALVHLRRNLALSKVMNAQASMLEALVGSAVSARVMSDIRDAVFSASAPIPEPTLAAFQSLVESTSLPDLRVALEGERLISLSTLYTTLGSQRIIASNRAANMNRINQIYDQIIPLSALPAAERRAAANSVSNSPLANSKLYPATTLLLPAFSRLFQSHDQIQLDRASTITFLAIERYRALNNNPPATLADLGALLPSIPADPFSRGGLICRPDATTPRGYVLYSTGLDAADNNRTLGPKTNFDALQPASQGTDFTVVPPYEEAEKK